LAGLLQQRGGGSPPVRGADEGDQTVPGELKNLAAEFDQLEEEEMHLNGGHLEDSNDFSLEEGLD